MKKKYLIKWEHPKFYALNDYTEYTLTIEVVWFRFFKKYKTIKYRVDDYKCHQDYYDKWDKLILNRTPIN